MFLHMIYNIFYSEEIDWIGYATRPGAEDLKGTNTELHTYFYVPEMTAEELKEAIIQTETNGAKGISLFAGPAITDEQ